MRKKLLAGAALAAALGCASVAMAQDSSKEGTGAGASHSQGGAQHQLSPGGAGGGNTMQRSQTTPGGAAQNQAVPDKKGMGPPKGTSQNEERGSSTMQRGAQDNDKTKTQRGAEENDKTKMQRGAEESDKTKTQRGAQENERPGMTRENGENNAQTEERGGRTGGMTGQNKGASAKSVQLSDSQRTQIKNIIVKNRDVARVTSPNFTVAVGTPVPRSVHVSALPPEVIRVVPEYEGFDYILVGDQLLIIDPDTMEIVAILPA